MFYSTAEVMNPLCVVIKRKNLFDLRNNCIVYQKCYTNAYTAFYD